MSVARPWRRKAAAFAAAAFAVLGAGQAAAQTADYKPTEDDAVLLQMQVKQFHLGSELRGYQTPQGVCVDLADVIQSLDLPIRLDKKSRRATGWVFAEDQSFTLDRDSNTVQIVNNKRALQPGELYDSPEGWCANTKALGGWLGVNLTVDMRNSLLLLQSDKPLPFLQAKERQTRAAQLSRQQERDLSAYPQARQPYALWRLPAIDVAASVSYNGQPHGAGRVDKRYEIYASGEAALASYDARLASDTKGVPQNLRVKAYRNDPDGKILGPLKATQVAAGDVELLPGNLAGASSVGRGAFITNRALQRPTTFGTTIVRGALPLGWDAELYRNGQLLAYQSEGKDGRYEFEVPLVYGQNAVEVVLHGPQGQLRRETQSVPVGYGAVPPGKVEYWAGVVERNHDLISFSQPPPATAPLDGGWHYAAGVQYGIDRATVIGASGHSLEIDGVRRNYGEITLQRALGSLLVGLTGSDEVAVGQAYRVDLLGKIGPVNVQAQSWIANGGYTSGIVGEGQRSASQVALDTLVHAGRTVLPFSAGYTRTQTRAGQSVNEALVRGGIILPFASVTAYVLDRWTDGFHDPHDGTRLGLLANTRIAGITARGEAVYLINGPHKGLESATLTFEKALTQRSTARFDLQRTADTHLTTFQLGYVRQFRQLALSTSGQVDSRGALGASLGVSFSFGRDPLAGRWRMSDDKLAQHGEAAVSVFLDEDGDGKWSPGDKPLPGVGITAGQSGAAAPTDKQGHAFVEGLQPYQKVLVSVDESTLPDPFLVPSGKGFVVTPRPGVPAVVQLAIAPTGEVEGELQTAEGSPAAGVQLELIRSDGSVAASTSSEYDGYFLFEKVVYGDYRLAVSPASEKALGLQDRLTRPIELNGKTALDRVGVVKLRPAATLAATP